MRMGAHAQAGLSVTMKAAHTVIISDLDGTLLDSRQQISTTNAAAIARFRQAGGLFVIATGRPWQSALPYACELGLEQPLIVCNGAQLYCPNRNTVLRTERLSLQPELSAWLYELQVQDNQLGLLLCTGDQMLTPCRNELIVQHERKDSLQSIATSLAQWQEAAQEAVKLLAVAQTPAAARWLEQQLSERMPGCTVVFSETNYLELLPEGCSKGTALVRLATLMDWQHKHLIAIGDQMNDAELLQTADLGIATGNAVPALQLLADAVTVSHEQHALAQIISEWLDTEPLESQDFTMGMER
ncbi:Cof-type HAD-IIB family hydrolase [Paenibacillus sp. FSL K6-1230]|uniref:Cof-type HAD-IIB family hydrolase n=1 Tax=Paenibacillus sp. FSL K6-1230 TaxID=2921603 RepID=UPI0030F82ED8